MSVHNFEISRLRVSVKNSYYCKSIIFEFTKKNSKLVKSVMYRTLRKVVLLVLCVAGIQTVLGWRSREEDESSRWTSRSKYTRPG